MTDIWAAKVLEGVPCFQTMSGNLLPYADALAAIAKLAEGDDLVERAEKLVALFELTRQTQKPDLGRLDAVDTITALLAHIAALTAQVAELQKATKSAEAVADNHWETLRSIRDIAKSSGDLARIVQWVDDAEAGYNETAEATLSAEMDRRIAAEDEAAALRAKVARLEGALGYYADQFCEGFCQDLPPGYTDENCERDCGGCKARAALIGEAHVPRE